MQQTPLRPVSNWAKVLRFLKSRGWIGGFAAIVILLGIRFSSLLLVLLSFIILFIAKLIALIAYEFLLFIVGIVALIMFLIYWKQIKQGIWSWPLSRINKLYDFLLRSRVRDFHPGNKRNFLTAVGIVIGLLSALYFTVPFLFHGKTLFDLLQIFITPLLVVIGGYIIGRIATRFQHDLTQSLRETERGREDRSESEKVLDELEATIITYIQRDIATLTESEKRVLSRRVSVASSRMTERDKLRLIISLAQENLIDRTNPVISLDGVDLTGVEFWRYRRGFPNCSFRGANLRGSSFKGIPLQNADLSEYADLRDVDFTDSFLEGAVLRGALYEDAQFNNVAPSSRVTLKDGSIRDLP